MEAKEKLPGEDEFMRFDGTAGDGGQAGGARRPFTAEQLVACERCGRSNPPTRMNCLYCGAPLPVTEQSAALRRPTLKKLEEWERGFNVIILPHGADESRQAAIADDSLAEAASVLRLEASRLSEMVASGRALPVARASSEEEAALVVERLGALGLRAEVFGDGPLSKTPARVRALTLDGDALVCWPSHEAEPTRVLWADVVLLVVGRIVTKRVEVEERQSRPGGDMKMVDARELVSDEAVLDIYANVDVAADGSACFRVLADGFDYSCLGESKGLLARDNFQKLVETLRGRAPSAEFDGEYGRTRALLSNAWPPSEQTGALGVRREGTGRYNTEAVIIVSNETQFTRYSRLRRQFARRGRAGS